MAYSASRFRFRGALILQGWTIGFPLRGRGRAFAGAKVPAGRCPCGSAGWIATGNLPPQQPRAVAVASNPVTLINQKPRTLSGTGLLVQGSFEGGRTHRDSAIIFGSLLLRSGYNSDKSHFNAWLDGFIPLMRLESSSQASPLSPFPRAWILQSLQPWLPRCGRL